MKEKQKKKFLNFKGMRIEERLKKAFQTIILIASVGSVAGILSLIIVVSNFERAMVNYALPQGDIALFMNEYAECRSNTRGIIGYEDQEQIDLMVSKHATRVANTQNRFATIKETKNTQIVVNKYLLHFFIIFLSFLSLFIYYGCCYWSTINIYFC